MKYKPSFLSGKRVPTSLPERITLVILALLLLYKTGYAFYYNAQSPLIFIVSWFHDSLPVLLLLFLFQGLARKFPDREKQLHTLHYTILGLFTILCFTYTPFIPDLLTFRINLFSVRTGQITFFADYFLKPAMIIPLAVVATVVVFLARRYPAGISNRIMTILSLFIISGFIVTSGRPNINPVISSVVSEVGSFFRKDYGIERISMNREPVKSSGYADSVNPSTDTIPPINSPYKKIIVLVMESISYDEFFNHGKNDQQGDRNRIFDNCLQYTNYYTNNLDSYTSLIAMLHSTFVPFQAYVDESRYKFVNERNNLVRIFKQNGYRTLFLTSYGEQQKRFIPALKEWDEVVCMKQFPDNFVKVTSNKIESASEDRAVFGDLIRFVRDHDQAFVFQEMVYGHTAEWKSKTGIGTLDYYRQYFQALNDTLAASNLLEGSLIVITSDHGPRQDAQLAANYHVPLMLLTARPENTRVTSLCSHLDFREILLGVMSGKPMDIGRQKIWTVGNSGDYIYGMIGSAGQYVFVDNRTLSVESNMPEQEVRSFTVDFQQYVVHFSGELKVGKL